MSPNPPVPEGFDALIARARAEDGQPPFSDQSLVELMRGERTLVEWTLSNGTAMVGAAIIGPDEFELVVSPEARGTGAGTALLTHVLTAHPAAEYAWAHGDHPASRALAASFGFEPVRTLLQLRALKFGRKAVSGLPGNVNAVSHLEPQPPSPVDPRISAFQPGIDDDAWFALNARAFAHHPEQGGLTRQDLNDRKAEDWFDAGDFLILRDGDTMIGFCWLKVDMLDGDDRIGEFYAIGIDPDRQGEGLGRVLMDAGLARLAERGIAIATLYVEADNEPALALYHRYGFDRYTIDVRYRWCGR